MPLSPVSVSIYIGDIPEEDTDKIFTFLRQMGSNFSFSVGDVYEDEENLDVITDNGVVPLQTLVDVYEASKAEDVIESETIKHFNGLQAVHFPDTQDGSCPTCIFGVDHEGECGPAWMPTDNR